jgi:hypothetical protein
LEVGDNNYIPRFSQVQQLLLLMSQPGAGLVKAFGREIVA